MTATLLADPLRDVPLAPGVPVKTLDGQAKRQAPPAGGAGVDAARRARADLRRQIARLEDRLAAATIELGEAVLAPAAPCAGPRLLDLDGLERSRDRLAGLVAHAGRRLAAQHAGQAQARRRLEEMLRDPERHRFARISLAELGEPGCGAYHVRPRLGLVGMLAGWWEVKLSSGCP